MNEYQESRINEIDGEINGLKQLLTMTDYKVLKYSEGLLTDEEYAEVRAYRQNLREKINQLEAELLVLN